MKKIFVVLALAMLVAGCDEENARQVKSLSGEGWRFTRDTTEEGTLKAADAKFNDSGWEQVEVPHDWAIAGPFDPQANGGSGKLPWKGVGWYRRSFELTPAEFARIQSGGALWLEFDGVMADSRVYVNGQLAGGWQYGYMSFRVDAAPFVKAGANSLAVRVDTRSHRSRWYPGAGIYRAVRMVAAPAVHIVPGSEFITTPGVARESATVHVEFTVTNRLARVVEVGAGFRIDGIGNSAPRKGLKPSAKDSARCTLPALGTAKFVFDVEVRQPRLWDVEHPELYLARLVVVDKATANLADVQDVRFGIRTFEFTADDGFHLNGRRVQLQGVDLHSDMGPLGMAFNRDVMRRQLRLMQEMGVNALRTSHNACDPQVLELCDEMGIVVWNECFDKWDGTAGRRGNQNIEEYVERNLRAFAQRDRNHPSVVAWSIGNEIGPDVGNNGSGMSAERFRRFRAAIREFDTTRPVGIGCCHTSAVASGMFAELDISGWNYREIYKVVKEKHPGIPVLYTESASALSDYGSFEQPPAAHKTNYDVAARKVGAYEHNAAPWSDIPDHEFFRMERDRYCGGEFVWTGIDYLGEPTPYVPGIVKGLAKSDYARSSYFGIADLMGIPKERYWLYRSHWNRKDHTIHLSPHWNWEGFEGKKVPVYVYTDGDEAELFLNGKSLGRRQKGVSQRPANLAAGKVITASSEEEKGGHVNRAALAVDGDGQSRWCAAHGGTGEWIQVDLGAKTEFRMVSLVPELGDGNYAWTIKVSDDGNAWRDYAKKKMGAAAKYEPKTEQARYVRVVFDELASATWASLYELNITNCEELYRLNPYYDVCDKYRLRWFDVKYAPGELKVVAYKQGKPIGTATQRTAEKPVAVKLTKESAVLLPGAVEFVQVDVVDAKGVRDPKSMARVKFAISGPGEILAVGNGDPRSHESFKQTSYPLFFGKAVAVIRRQANSSEPITLTASVDGLKSDSVTYGEFVPEK